MFIYTTLHGGHNMKKYTSIFTAAATILSLCMCSFYAECADNYDIVSDNSVDCFDIVSARKSFSENNSQMLSDICDYVLGKGTSKTDDWVLTWSDEFDGNELDSTKWSYDLGNWLLDSKGNYETSGWGNNEQEFYTDKNTVVNNGTLKIQAKKENYTDSVQGTYEYTSSRITTKNKFSVCGGKIEVRAKADSGKSLWPAIWMLPEETVYGKWAASGEIDIMEGYGSMPEKICGTIHFGDTWPNNEYLTSEYFFKENDSTENWHTYSLEWDKNCMKWYVDDVLYSTQTDWYSSGRTYPAPFDQNFYIILNLAVGGHFDGIDGIYADPSIFENGPKEFEIDYVRVYQKNGVERQPTELTCESLKAYIEDGIGSLKNSDNGCNINIKSVGTKEYSVMGILENRKVQTEKTYSLDFDIWSTADREMVLTVENASYDRYLDEKINLTSEPAHYHYDLTFDVNNIVDVKFQLDNIGNADDLGEHSVTVSNIKWTEK